MGVQTWGGSITERRAKQLEELKEAAGSRKLWPTGCLDAQRQTPAASHKRSILLDRARQILAGGTVKLTRIVRDPPSMSGSHCFSASTRHFVPHKKGAGSQQTVVSSPEQVTPQAKKIPNESVYRQESLRVSGGFEPPHLSL